MWVKGPRLTLRRSLSSMALNSSGTACDCVLGVLGKERGRVWC